MCKIISYPHRVQALMTFSQVKQQLSHSLVATIKHRRAFIRPFTVVIHSSNEHFAQNSKTNLRKCTNGDEKMSVEGTDEIMNVHSQQCNAFQCRFVPRGWVCSTLSRWVSLTGDGEVDRSVPTTAAGLSTKLLSSGVAMIKRQWSGDDRHPQQSQLSEKLRNLKKIVTTLPHLQDIGVHLLS